MTEIYHYEDEPEYHDGDELKYECGFTDHCINDCKLMSDECKYCPVFYRYDEVTGERLLKGAKVETEV